MSTLNGTTPDTPASRLARALASGQSVKPADAQQAARALELHAAALAEARSTLCSVAAHIEGMIEHIDTVGRIMDVDLPSGDATIVWRELARLRSDRMELQHENDDLRRQLAAVTDAQRPAVPSREPGGDPDAPTMPIPFP